MTKTLADTKLTSSPQLLGMILDELRLLRREVDLLLPTEDIKEYAHPDRIKRSYGRALKQYPPRLVWTS